MNRALTLAARGRGQTSPNPMVGAVVVKGGVVVGEGYHRRTGEPHAEIVALSKAKNRARGATLYVTLEPCCHTGRTGPCTQEIINAGIRRVVYASKDPDPRVNGRGGRILRSAGVKVTSGILATESEELNEYYIASQRLGRPFVILKLAQSLDGRIATSSGDSRWISSRESRTLVHRLRSEVDAVLVGAGTVRKDNPELTVRMASGHNPYRIVLEGSTPLARSRHLFASNRDHKTIIATCRTGAKRRTSSSRPVDPIIWTLKPGRHGLPRIDDLLAVAHRFGIRSIMVEGGSAVAAAFLKSRLVDKLMLFTAPILLGDGLSAIGSIGVNLVKHAVTFDRQTVTSSGPDLLFVGVPKWKK
jgi:diaminohydroxyphosphoribosylaminopyrimidine deaminase / 5-amino-6-(5-phosphoribosylamino)uracil reductase